MSGELITVFSSPAENVLNQQLDPASHPAVNSRVGPATEIARLEKVLRRTYEWVLWVPSCWAENGKYSFAKLCCCPLVELVLSRCLFLADWIMERRCRHRHHQESFGADAGSCRNAKEQNAGRHYFAGQSLQRSINFTPSSRRCVAVVYYTPVHSH